MRRSVSYIWPDLYLARTSVHKRLFDDTVGSRSDLYRNPEYHQHVRRASQGGFTGNCKGDCMSGCRMMVVNGHGQTTPSSGLSASVLLTLEKHKLLLFEQSRGNRLKNTHPHTSIS